MDTFAHGMSHPSKGPGAVGNGFVDKKMRCRNFSSYSIAAEYTTAVSVYTDENLKK
jgi:hypothetical protein